MAHEVGGRTLEMFSGTPRLNAWMYERFAPYVRGAVLEVGSGIGNISEHIVRDASRVVLTDLEDDYLAALAERYARDPRVSVERWNLDDPPPARVASERFDAIVAINVIEHIADDRTAVSRLASLLAPGGHLLAYVPAVPFAFGTVDEALGHHRRYTPATFAALLESAGLEPGPVRYMNLLGLPGWILNGRILRRRTLDARQVALFERLMPLVRYEDRLRVPIGLGVFARARKRE